MVTETLKVPWVASKYTHLKARIFFLDSFNFLMPHIEVPDRGSLVQDKKDSLARFIHVLKPLCDIYKLPVSKLHVFYDTSGQLIAFNRSASLFVNLRYFEAWRESMVFWASVDP